MRKKYALRNVLSKAMYAMIYAVLSFVTRKIFIYCLGDTVLGLSSLMTSILSMLSLMELGVGNAIYFSLYKPLAEGDDAQVNAIMKLYKKSCKKRESIVYDEYIFISCIQYRQHVNYIFCRIDCCSGVLKLFNHYLYGESDI